MYTQGSYTLCKEPCVSMNASKLAFHGLEIYLNP